MASGHFAVIDTETTGLFPGGHDRIVEIAIVTMDRQGSVVERWETLVNPGRDLGKQSLHGIRAADILEAPRFADIADELSWRLSGSVVVAHNLSFDARFLLAEFGRTQVRVPEDALHGGVCTMRLAHQYLPGAGRTLQDCCDAFGIPLEHAHSASADAEAAAILLSRYMELDHDLPLWDEHIRKAAATNWHAGTGLTPCRPVLRTVADSPREHFLERMAARMPEFDGPVHHEEYLAVLDQALLDRHLSAHEQAALIDVAAMVGIGPDEAAALHVDYFGALTASAWADGILTAEESEDLVAVARLLAIDPATVTDALDGPPSAPRTMAGEPVDRSLTAGDLVVLTGDMSRSRTEIEGLLSRAGFTPHKAVTKKVRLLVAADPDSLSGKARKARDYGIPVVDEDYLWNVVLR
ncbi:DNA polymerase III subunit epsilon [Citricoccus sp. SGAir0253]|nr:DNA polymerase III subunit epsilon [Citricoccus sp. SGAir0253]